MRICEARNIENNQNLYKKIVSVPNAYDNLVQYYFEADKKYNSGLFDFVQDTTSAKIQIDNQTLSMIICELYPPFSPYRFDVIPVEIIGSAYEQFLGNEIRIERNKVIIEQKPDVRKAGGVYYTPQYIVNYIIEKTIGKLIEKKTPDQISKIKIIDPSCGSGSFLLGAYQFLLNYHLDYYLKNKHKFKSIPVGDDGKLTTLEKKRILNNNIFGVDLDERAVEIAKLSLLLKVLEDETSETLADERLLGFKEKVLPNLDMNIKCGNSLIGNDLKKVVTVVTKSEITEINPFDWQVVFPQVFKQGGFDAVIGNPPYVQSREGQLGEAAKLYYYQTFKTAEYQLNTFGLFMEKSLTTLLKEKGVLGFIIPNYWLSTQYDKKLRKFMFQQNKTNEIINVYKVFESAVVDTLIIITEKQGIKTHGINVSSIDRNLKTIDQRLSAIRQNAWSYNEVKNVDFQSDDVEISFNKTFELKGDATIGDYFDLKFGAKLYEVGKGNPAQTKAFSENGVYESDKRKDITYKKLLRARSIKKHFIDWGNNWVKYGDNLAAPRTAELFMGERLLLQRIVSKETLDVVFTDQEYICNTDVITLKPKNKTIPCKFFAGILGSFLCCKYIKSTNVNLDRAAFPKINTNTLQDFPIPNLLNVKKSHVSQIVKLVESISQIKNDIVGSTDAREREKLIQKIAYTENAINEIVGELYGLTKEEIRIIEG